MPANDQRSMPNRFDQIDVSVNRFVDQARCQARQTPRTHNGHHLTRAVQADISRALETFGSKVTSVLKIDIF